MSDQRGDSYLETLMDSFRSIFAKHYMRLELVPYANSQGLHQALSTKEVHVICVESGEETKPYQTLIRVPRLYELMQAELLSLTTTLTFVETSDQTKTTEPIKEHHS